MTKYLKLIFAAIVVAFSPITASAEQAGASAFSEAATAVLDTAGLAVVATFLVKDGEIDRFREEMKINEAASRMEPGIRDYRTYQDRENPNLFVNFEAYVDQKAFDDHVATPHVQRLLPILEEILQEPIGITFLVHYDG